MKQLYESAKKGDPLSFALLLVVALLFVSALGICFSLLIYETKQSGSSGFGALPTKSEKDQPKTEITKLDVEDIKVGEVSGVITSIEDNKITFKTSVYGEQEHEIAIILDEKDQGNIFKYETSGTKNQGVLQNVIKTKLDYDKLEPGDFLTLRFPLEVPFKEVRNGSLLIEEIIVDDEFDENLEAE